MADKITEPLLKASHDYTQAKRAFETAIAAARNAGWDDERIAPVIGFTQPMVKAVAGKRDAA